MTSNKSTAFVASLGWEIAGFQSGKITKVLLSDGKTMIPFSEQLQRDIEAATMRERGDSGAKLVHPLDQSAA